MTPAQIDQQIELIRAQAQRTAAQIRRDAERVAQDILSSAEDRVARMEHIKKMIAPFYAAIDAVSEPQLPTPPATP